MQDRTMTDSFYLKVQAIVILLEYIRLYSAVRPSVCLCLCLLVIIMQSFC